MKTSHALLCSLAVLAAPWAHAHSDEYLDSQPTPHGGQMHMAGAYHFELVLVKDSKEARDNTVLVYITDHAMQKIPSAGASGNVTLLWGKEKSSAVLKADGDNRLKGTARYASLADLKAVVTISFPGKTTEQARFTPLAKSMSSAASMSGMSGHQH
jgi:hypothetical protein